MVYVYLCKPNIIITRFRKHFTTFKHARVKQRKDIKFLRSFVRAASIDYLHDAVIRERLRETNIANDNKKCGSK
jgi:hypothetical protein